ncbi:Fc.00g077620.m01.CDS01 [Cosmosporella sp. VM-42]
MSSRSNSNSHRRHSREPLEDFPPLPVPRLPSLRALAAQRDRDSTSPTSSVRHWSAASRRAERIRNLENRAPPWTDDLDRSMEDPWAATNRLERIRSEGRPTNFEDLDRSLEEANSHLRALLDLHNHNTLTTPLMPTNFSPPLRPQDLSDDNRRHKRRKLDSDRLVPSFKGFRYGKYGQVEPGQLRMEIVSCDGGMFLNSDTSYPPENILKSDNSVYCTKGNRCNIVLRHQGATVFTLQELVIKAPASMNYSHPVREGMVFIAMNQDEILSRTAQYQIQYTPKPQENVSLEEGGLRPLEPTEVVSIQHHDNGTTTTRARRAYVYRTNPDDYAESRTPLMPREFTTNLPDFRITTECSDDEDDEYEGGGSRSLRRGPPNRIGVLPFENNDSDSDDGNPFGSEDYLEDPHHPSHWRLYNAHAHSPPSRRPPPQSRSSLSLAEAWEAHASATQDAVRAVGGELLAPHARFYIEKKKSKCTIRFDPPVSGRFILLKMWSSHHDPSSNIDIQSVMARGFAGPRYFPSVELR